MDTRAHVFITGDVIGVGFRAWVYHNARSLRLTGWVSNANHRMVEAVFEGSREKIEEMVTLCHKGPDVAWVENVRVEWNQASGEFVGFEIRY